MAYPLSTHAEVPHDVYGPERYTCNVAGVGDLHNRDAEMQKKTLLACLQGQCNEDSHVVKQAA